MRHCPSPPLLEARVRAAWQTQLVSAGTMPGLRPALVRHRHELLPRFTASYTQLRALPRRVRRALQRQWRLPLAGIALLLALGQSPGIAAPIPVGGACTLVDALTAANTDTATGGCVAGSGADTVVLPTDSIHTLTEVNNETYGATGLPVIRSVITVEGQGSTIARANEAPEFRLLAVSNVGELTLQESTVSGGIAPAPAGGPYRGGGGVANYGGTLMVLNSTISGNSTAQYCSFICYAGGGGGVFNSSGTVTILNSTLSGNGAGIIGGGVFNGSGTVTILNSTLSGNGGGGVENYGTVTILNSTLSGNGGGGVFNSSGTVTILNSTLSGNAGRSVTNFDNGTGTITNSTLSGNAGSGVANYGSSTVTITNSTLSGNAASSDLFGGGGVLNYGGTVTVTHSTLAGNAASFGGGVSNRGGTLTLVRTLVSGNTAPTGPEVFNSGGYYGGGTVLADNHNLFGVDGTAGVEGFSPGATDIVPPAGVLLPDILDPTLAFHGGFTQTHALVPGSPAIDAGGPVCLDATGTPLLTDQRGKPRLVDGDGDGTAVCDIGAVEFFPMVNDFVTLDPALETAFDPTAVLGGLAGTFTVTATFTNTSATPLRVPFFRVIELSGGNLLLNADEGVQGVGATLTPEVGDSILAPGEAVTVDFVLGLQVQAPFTFLVDLFGEPLL